MKAEEVKKEIKKFADPERAKNAQRYFKTGKGQYGYGDVFLGLSVPLQRKIAKKFEGLPLSEIKKLISSKIHEHRFIALIILLSQYQKGTASDKKSIVNFYLKNKKYINNWDLVDTSAPRILGDWFLNKEKSFLYKMAKSKNIWDRRIAILSTFWFIKHNRFEDSIKLARILLSDKHDLIHKAVGWMLREMGKRSETELEAFLDKNYRLMPRTMLRYAIERLPEKKRLYFMHRLHY
jgi:3-methyladenine DNA glycosylase AlkD